MKEGRRAIVAGPGPVSNPNKYKEGAPGRLGMAGTIEEGIEPRALGAARPSRRRPFPGDPSDLGGFHALALQFLEHQAILARTPRTVDTYRQALGYFVRWALERGLVRPGEVTRPVVERYQQDLFHYRKSSGEPLSFSAQQQRLTAVKLHFRWLARRRLIPEDPAAELEIPRVRRRLPNDVLTPEEAELVLAQPDPSTADGLRDRAILEVLYSTGMRRLELVGVSLWDIDRTHNTVFVRLGKGRKDRIVPIGKRALAWIDSYLLRARSRCAPCPDPGHLFLSPSGGQTRPDTLTAMARRMIEKAGVRKRGACHIFRHTMATAMHENGADIRFIQQILGHESLETTQIYTRVSIRQLREVHATTHPTSKTDKTRMPAVPDAPPPHRASGSTPTEVECPSIPTRSAVQSVVEPPSRRLLPRAGAHPAGRSPIGRNAGKDEAGGQAGSPPPPAH
jgi:integrase/recombinase XerD